MYNKKMMNYPTTRRMGGSKHLSHPPQPQPQPPPSSSTLSLSNHRRRSSANSSNSIIINNSIGQNRGSRGVNTAVSAVAATMNSYDNVGSQTHHTTTVTTGRRHHQQQQYRMYNSTGRRLPSATTTTRMMMSATAHHQFPNNNNNNKNLRSSSSSSSFMFNRTSNNKPKKKNIYPQQQQQQHQDGLLFVHQEEELEDQQQQKQLHEWRDVNNDADFPMSQLTDDSFLRTMGNQGSSSSSSSNLVSHNHHGNRRLNLFQQSQQSTRGRPDSRSGSTGTGGGGSGGLILSHHRDEDIIDPDDVDNYGDSHVLEEIPLGQQSLSMASSASTGTGTMSKAKKYSTKGITGGPFCRPAIKMKTATNNKTNITESYYPRHETTMTMTDENRQDLESDPSSSSFQHEDGRDPQNRRNLHSSSCSTSTTTPGSGKKRTRFSADTRDNEKQRTASHSSDGSASATSTTHSSGSSTSTTRGPGCGNISGASPSQIQVVGTGDPDRLSTGISTSHSKNLLDRMAQKLRSNRRQSSSPQNSTVGSTHSTTSTTLRYPSLRPTSDRQRGEPSQKTDIGGDASGSGPGSGSFGSENEDLQPEQQTTNINQVVSMLNNDSEDRLHVDNSLADDSKYDSPTFKTTNDDAFGPHTRTDQLKADFFTEIDTILTKKKADFEKSILSDVGIEQKCDGIVRTKTSEFKNDLDSAVANVKSDCVTTIDRSVKKIHETALSMIQSSLKSTEQSSLSTLEKKENEIETRLDAKCTNHLDDMEQQFHSHESSLKDTATNLLGKITQAGSNVLDSVAENIHSLPRSLRRLVDCCLETGSEGTKGKPENSSSDIKSISDSASTAIAVSSRSMSSSQKRVRIMNHANPKPAQLSTSPMTSSSTTKPGSGESSHSDVKNKKRRSNNLQASPVPSNHKKQRIRSESPVRTPAMCASQSVRAGKLSSSSWRNRDARSRTPMKSTNSAPSHGTSPSPFPPKKLEGSQQDKKRLSRKRSSSQSRITDKSPKNETINHGRRRQKVEKDPKDDVSFSKVESAKTKVTSRRTPVPKVPKVLVVDAKKKQQLTMMSPIGTTPNKRTNSSWTKTKKQPKDTSATTRRRRRRKKKPSTQSSLSTRTDF